MQFLNTEKPYVHTADHFRPLYALSNQSVPEAKKVEFTGYKSKKFEMACKESEIPLDGSRWMFKISPEILDGVFGNLLELLQFGYQDLGMDPRARVKSNWRIVSGSDINRIQQLCHIYGVTENLWIAQMTGGDASE